MLNGRLALAVFFAVTIPFEVARAGDPLSPDSLNVQFVGCWSFGPRSYAAVCDSARGLVFLGAAGGVYVLDVADSTRPSKRSEISTVGAVLGLCYRDDYLYVADGSGGGAHYLCFRPRQSSRGRTL